MIAFTQAEASAIDIAPDDDVSLQVLGGARTTARVVGNVPNQYLILRDTQPGSGLEFGYGDVVILRYLHDGVVYAFHSLVLNAVRTPEPLLFVSYPQNGVKRHPLRQAQRLACSLPCHLTLNDVTQTALTVDISETGCQCALPLPDEALALDAYQNQTVTVTLASVEDADLRLVGTVRRCTFTAGSLRLGIQFQEAQPEAFRRIANLLRLAG